VRETGEAEVVLRSLRAELDLVQRSLEEALLDPVLGNVLERVVERLLAFLDVL
jgi:hypothetical protein